MRAVLMMILSLLALIVPGGCRRQSAGGGALLGERCSTVADCAPGADRCQEIDGQRFCTRACSKGCPADFECRPLQTITETQLVTTPICIPRRRLTAPRL
jgi:hypothetical protein